jgi:hypothetical protein
MVREFLPRLGGVFVAVLLLVGTTAAQAQDAEVTCSWVGQRQACHTLDEWEKMARVWCDRYQAAKARREQEQTLGWGTNAMYGSSRGAELTRINKSKPIRCRSARANNKG